MDASGRAQSRELDDELAIRVDIDDHRPAPISRRHVARSVRVRRYALTCVANCVNGKATSSSKIGEEIDASLGASRDRALMTASADDAPTGRSSRRDVGLPVVRSPWWSAAAPVGHADRHVATPTWEGLSASGGRRDGRLRRSPFTSVGVGQHVGDAHVGRDYRLQRGAATVGFDGRRLRPRRGRHVGDAHVGPDSWLASFAATVGVRQSPRWSASGRRPRPLPSSPRRSASVSRREAQRRGLSVDSVRATLFAAGVARPPPTAGPRRFGCCLSCC